MIQGVQRQQEIRGHAKLRAYLLGPVILLRIGSYLLGWHLDVFRAIKTEASSKLVNCRLAALEAEVSDIPGTRLTCEGQASRQSEQSSDAFFLRVLR